VVAVHLRILEQLLLGVVVVGVGDGGSFPAAADGEEGALQGTFVHLWRVGVIEIRFGWSGGVGVGLGVWFGFGFEVILPGSSSVEQVAGIPSTEHPGEERSPVQTTNSIQTKSNQRNPFEQRTCRGRVIFCAGDSDTISRH